MKIMKISERINILIIDDDPIARQSITKMLQKYCPEVRICGEADSAAEARTILSNTKIDALFLDISMPDENGFDLLESIDSSKYMVVFTTSSNQFLIKAIRVDALDYLMKPIDLTELRTAVDKMVKTKKKRSQLSGPGDQGQSLTTSARNSQEKHIMRLSLPDMDGFTIIDINDIVYLETDHNDTVFHMADGRIIVVRRPIKIYENALDFSVFFRVDKSMILNLRHLKKFSRIDGYYAVMTDESSIAVSSKCMPDFIKAVAAFNNL